MFIRVRGLRHRELAAMMVRVRIRFGQHGSVHNCKCVCNRPAHHSTDHVSRMIERPRDGLVGYREGNRLIRMGSGHASYSGVKTVGVISSQPSLHFCAVGMPAVRNGPSVMNRIKNGTL